jgi:hypothetical protein
MANALGAWRSRPNEIRIHGGHSPEVRASVRLPRLSKQGETRADMPKVNSVESERHRERSRRPRRMSRSITALAVALALFRPAHPHDRWDNGEPVPTWVKTECCGPKDAHRLRPDQVSRNAAGDYVVDIYPDPIPAHIALPSQDGDYWLFFYNDYVYYGTVRCFFVPSLF